MWISLHHLTIPENSWESRFVGAPSDGCTDKTWRCPLREGHMFSNREPKSEEYIIRDYPREGNHYV